MTNTYTTKGPVRGCCGHNHRSLEAAARCLKDDQSGCHSQGGYSDRTIERTDGEEMTEADIYYGDDLMFSQQVEANL